MELTPKNIEQISDAVVSRMISIKREYWVEPESHYIQHSWVIEQMQEQIEWRKFRNKILQSAVIWALIGFLGFGAMAFWKEIASHFVAAEAINKVIQK